MRGSLFALTAVLLLGIAVTAPGLAAAASAGNDDPAGNAPLAVAVAQDEGVTVSVTENGTGVPNASVVVTTADGNASYAGVGNYTTGPNGTVGLADPVENVTIDVTTTHDNRTATTTATLTAEAQPFGQAVDHFVSILQSESAGPIGPTLASWVVANNPGNAPEHAGPPAHAGPGSGSNGTDAGPPDDAGGPDDAGPPEHAGPDAGEDVNETTADEDDADDGTETDDADGADGDEDDGDEDDGTGGPPTDAGPPDHAKGN